MEGFLEHNFGRNIWFVLDRDGSYRPLRPVDSGFIVEFIFSILEVLIGLGVKRSR